MEGIFPHLRTRLNKLSHISIINIIIFITTTTIVIIITTTTTTNNNINSTKQ